MANVLMIHPNKCTGCRSCELACTFVKEGQFRPRASRVHVFTWDREGISVPMMCQHGDPAPCVSVCTPGAMRRNRASALVEWDAKRCIRCRMRVQACPFGNAVYDTLSNSIFKCDTCDGAPECVALCPNKALEFSGLSQSRGQWVVLCPACPPSADPAGDRAHRWRSRRAGRRGLPRGPARAG